MTFLKCMMLSVLVLGLAACSSSGGAGNSGSATPGADNSLAFDATSDASSDIFFASISLVEGVATTSWVYDRANGTLGSVDDPNAYDAESGELTVDEGLATLVQTGDYSGTFISETSGTTRFGVFGVAASDAPTSGSVAYEGSADMTIVDGQSLFEVQGSMNAFVDFDDQEVDVVLDNLSGTQADAFGVPQGSVDDVATLEILAADIDGAEISGGIVEFASEVIGVVPSDSVDLDHTGSFYGPEYDEMGGAFVIDDSEAGSLMIFGTYTGD